MADLDIDLYGDVEQEFPQEDFGDGDLFDAVLTGDRNNDSNQNGSSLHRSKSHSDSMSDDKSLGLSSSSIARAQMYVGNLTWWTTDEDIIKLLHTFGVSDVVEVKFHENRINGQSKGFCALSLASETSARTVADKLPKKEIHGMVPTIAPFTKQSLQLFESKSKTRSVPQHQQQRFSQPNNRMNQTRGHQNNNVEQRNQMHSMPHAPPSINMNSRPIAGIPNSIPGHLSRPLQHVPPPTTVAPRGPPPPTMGPLLHTVPPPRGPPPMVDARVIPRPEFMQGPPPLANQPPPVLPPTSSVPPPAPHVNPAFFPHGGPPPSVVQAVPPTHYPPPAPHPSGPGMPPSYNADHRVDVPPPLSDAEFEDIMNRNRTVSSSAIARAVADASSGEYAGAIETLVTAISLIKQSKVAQDERCKILISSLQDTLHGIEAKSYGSKRRDRSRSPRRHKRSRSRGYRSRSHSREREYERPRERERERERRERDYERPYSNDRDYEREREKERERERERERYYEERYRERERERRERIEERVGPRERIEDTRREEPPRERERDRERDRDRDREREREVRSRDERETSHRSRH